MKITRGLSLRGHNFLKNSPDLRNSNQNGVKPHILNIEMGFEKKKPHCKKPTPHKLNKELGAQSLTKAGCRVLQIDYRVKSWKPYPLRMSCYIN